MSDEIEEKWMDLDFISQVFKECSCESCGKTFHNSDCLNENMTQEHEEGFTEEEIQSGEV